jgi:hypothetical protein
MSGPRSVFDPPRPAKPRTPELDAGPPVSKRGGKKPNSISRRGKFRFAAALAERIDDDEMAWRLNEIMDGRDPAAPRDADGNVIVAPGSVHVPLDWKVRMKAYEMFLNRKHGQAPAALLIEEELHVKAAVVHTALSPAAIARMEPEAKADLRALLRKAVAGELEPPRQGRLSEAVEAARDANPTD